MRAAGPDGRRPLQHGCPDRYTERAAVEVLKFDSLVLPYLLDRAHRRAARFGLALLELMDGALGETHAEAELALAPAEHGAGHAHLGGEGKTLETDEFDEIAG